MSRIYVSYHTTKPMFGKKEELRINVTDEDSCVVIRFNDDLTLMVDKEDARKLMEELKKVVLKQEEVKVKNG